MNRASETCENLPTRVVGDVPAFHNSQRPLSPWLRLAHRRRQPFGPSRVPLQHLLDFELLLVLEGRPWLWVEPAGGAIRLRPGSLALIPPNIVHTWGDTSDTHLAIHFDLLAQPDLAPLENMVVSRRWVTYQPARWLPQVRWMGFGGLGTPLVRHLDDPSPWQRRMEELLTYSAGRTSAQFGLDEQVAVQTLLLWAVRSWIALESPPPANDPIRRIQALLKHIDPTERAAIDELAERSSMSQTAFRTAFRSVTGTSPRRWLEQRRVELAARRLMHTDLSVVAIAHEVGYPDAYHFSRVFKRVTGKSPNRYRQAIRRQSP